MKIKKITREKFEGTVYNFMCEPNHTYFSEDVLTHNCDVPKVDAGLQFSINSTCDKQRDEMFSGSALSLAEISEIGKNLPAPIGRKYTLNFALADEYELDANKLVKLFDPEKFMVKLTPLHLTKACEDNDIKTTDGYS